MLDHVFAGPLGLLDLLMLLLSGLALWVAKWRAKQNRTRLNILEQQQSKLQQSLLKAKDVAGARFSELEETQSLAYQQQQALQLEFAKTYARGTDLQRIEARIDNLVSKKNLGKIEE